MGPVKRFGAVLLRLRQEQGFKSPHEFYRSREGRRNLGLSFANYLSLERGASLPKGWRLKGILHALGLQTHSPQARELVRAYLTAVLGSDELLENSSAPEARDEIVASRTLAEDAAQQSLSQRTVQLSLDQWRVIAQSSACYACETFLVNTPGWTKVAEIGRAVGLASGPLKKALKALAGAGVAELSGDQARSPYARKLIRPPAPLSAAAGLHSAMYKYRQEWIDKRAKLADMTSIRVRMSKKGLERYRHHLAEAVVLSAVYGDVDRTEDTAIYLVEGRIYGVFS